MVSALIFAGGRVAWLRSHWREGACVPLVSRTTAQELVRVLAYPKFGLEEADREELLADYLPFCEVVSVRRKCAVQCRDRFDQPFLDLAHAGGADVLVTGDSDLLFLRGRTAFNIETPEDYRARVG